MTTIWLHDMSFVVLQTMYKNTDQTIQRTHTSGSGVLATYETSHTIMDQIDLDLIWILFNLLKMKTPLRCSHWLGRGRHVTIAFSDHDYPVGGFSRKSKRRISTGCPISHGIPHMINNFIKPHLSGKVHF